LLAEANRRLAEATRQLARAIDPNWQHHAIDMIRQEEVPGNVAARHSDARRKKKRDHGNAAVPRFNRDRREQ
jgi:hypothetical protein